MRGLVRLVRRLGAVLAVAVVVVAVSAGPASAHSAANSPASNYVSTLQTVAPSPGGVFSAAVIEGGSRLELRWRSGPEILVLGYEGEPYLRVGPDGVFENVRSPAVAVNKSRTGANPDPNADASATPVWKKTSSGSVVRWHDHRVHYMGSERPDAVRRDPGSRHTIQTWSVPVKIGATTYTLDGELAWVPGPSALPYLVVAAVVAAALGAVGLWGTSRRGRVLPVVIVALVALLAVDVVHLVGITFGVKGGLVAGIGRLLTIGYASIAAWAAGIIAIVLLLRRRDDALYLVVFSAGLMTVVGGLADLSILSRSSVVFAFAPALARVCVAATLGLGVGLAVAGVLLTRTVPAGRSEAAGDGAPSPDAVPTA